MYIVGMTVPLSIIGDLVVLVGLGLALLSAAGAPLYFFDDVMGLDEGVAGLLAAGVVGLLTLYVNSAPEWDLMASYAIFQLTGIRFGRPLLWAGIGLTALYGLGGLGALTEDSDDELMNEG